MSDGTSSRAPAVTRITLCAREHRRGPELDLEPRGILGEIAIVEADDLGLPFAALDEGLRKRCRPFGHKPRVGSVDAASRGTPGSGDFKKLATAEDL